ncbi:MAG: hypothetical protein ACRDOU_31920 [Streptosporangiaceae bacterium]
MTTPETPETTEAMVARVRASLDRQSMMATLGVELIAVEHGRVQLALRQAFADDAERPFAAMQATMTALYDRPGISG